jgi:hypothetical protein
MPLLITLLETSTLTSVATEGLSLKSFPLGIHLLALVIHHNSAVHKCLKIGIGIGHQLQLYTIIQSLQEAALLITVISHLIWSIS